MTVERFLGGAWASMHAPGQGEPLLKWVLEQGFRGVIPAPGPRPVDWRALREPLRLLPARVPAVRLGSILDPENRPDAGMCSAKEAERAACRGAIEEAIGLARGLSCNTVILEPGIVPVAGEVGSGDLGDGTVRWTADRARAQLARRNAVLDGALDRCCRFLYELCGAFPDMQVCLTGSRHVFSLGEPRALAAIFEDLTSRRISYWHDAAVSARRAALLGTDQGEWLEIFCNRLVGMTLGDVGGGGMYLPPGAGGVDYPLLAAYRLRSGRPLPVSIELDPAVGPAEIPGVHAYLGRFGL